MSIISWCQNFLSARLPFCSRKHRYSHANINRAGMSTRVIRLVAPIAKLIDKLGCQFILDFTVIHSIRWYQRYLSPQKGFSCAYSRLYGAESCSEYFRQMVKTYGLSKATSLFEQRLRDCKQANIILKEQRYRKRS
jgi:putative component of membrane protein insertase Oxa1/YidC/SpoIIIJ protein YidD